MAHKYFEKIRDLVAANGSFYFAGDRIAIARLCEVAKYYGFNLLPNCGNHPNDEKAEGGFYFSFGGEKNPMSYGFFYDVNKTPKHLGLPFTASGNHEKEPKFTHDEYLEYFSTILSLIVDSTVYLVKSPKTDNILVMTE